MIEIIKYILLFCVAIIVSLMALILIFILICEYPIRANIVIVAVLILLGVPILYIPVVYLLVIVLVCIIIAIILWAASMDKSINTLEKQESPSEEEQEVTSLKISPETSDLSPGQKQNFQAEGLDKSGNKVGVDVVMWSATGGIINSQGDLTVYAISKGNFEVTANTADGRLECTICYTVLPELSSIKIEQPTSKLLHGENIKFNLLGLDQSGDKITIQEQIFWQTTIERNDSVGRIDSTGKLVIDQMNEVALVIAKVGNLKDEIRINVENNTIAKTSNNYIIAEDPNNILHRNENVNYSLPLRTIHPSPLAPFNLDHNQETIDSEVFKKHNSPQIYDYDNYEDDDLCLKQEYIITVPVTKIIEPSRLVALEIDAPDLIFLKPNQERLFTVYGIDQFGKYIDHGKILWRATGGTIDSQGKLIVENDIKGSFRVTAISSNARISQNRLRQNLLLIKTSLKIFSWVLSHKRFAKDTVSYFIQDFCDSEAFVNEILPDIDTSNTGGLLTVLVFDDIKDWVIEAIVNVIIDCLDKFISLCFVEDFNPLVCSISYVVLPELKSQESLKVVETVGNSFGILNNNDIQSGLTTQRLKSPPLIQSLPSRTNIRQDIYLAEPHCNDTVAELRRIRIVSYNKTINSSNTIKFKLLGTDQNRKRILIKAPIIWKTTDGQISSTGRLIFNNLNNIIQVTATVGQLEAKTDMRSYRRHYTKSGTFTQY